LLVQNITAKNHLQRQVTTIVREIEAALCVVNVLQDTVKVSFQQNAVGMRNAITIAFGF